MCRHWFKELLIPTIQKGRAIEVYLLSSVTWLLVTVYWWSISCQWFWAFFSPSIAAAIRFPPVWNVGCERAPNVDSLHPSLKIKNFLIVMVICRLSFNSPSLAVLAVEFTLKLSEHTLDTNYGLFKVCRSSIIFLKSLSAKMPILFVCSFCRTERILFNSWIRTGQRAHMFH